MLTESTKAQRRQLIEGPPDSKVAKDVSYFWSLIVSVCFSKCNRLTFVTFLCAFGLWQLVYVALHHKRGGEEVINEYNRTNGLTDQSRRKLVNILVADMIESHGWVKNNILCTLSLFISILSELHVLDVLFFVYFFLPISVTCNEIGGYHQLMSASPTRLELWPFSPIWRIKLHQLAMWVAGMCHLMLYLLQVWILCFGLSVIYLLWNQQEYTPMLK